MLVDKALAAIPLQQIEGTGLRVPFNMSTLFKLIASSFDDGINDEPRDNLETYYRSTVESIRKADIPVRSSLNVDEITEKYKDRKKH